MDAGRLRAAVEALIENRDMLRAYGRLDSRQGCRIEIAAEGRPVCSLDLSDLPSSERQAAAHAEILQDALADHDGRFRAVLVRFGDDHHILTLIPHHVVVDGVSLNAIAQQIGRAYEHGEEALRPDTGTAEALLSQVGAAEAAARNSPYWPEYLDDLPEQPGIPAARARSGDAVDQTGLVVLGIDESRHDSARALARQAGVRTLSAAGPWQRRGSSTIL